MTRVEAPEVVTVTQRFDAPAGRVFDAWLDPDLVRKWFAPGMGEMTRVEVDPRPGGSFSFVQLRDDKEVENRGEYLEMKRPRRLLFTWSTPGLSRDMACVSVDIVPRGAGCELTLNHELHASWVEHADRTKA